MKRDAQKRKVFEDLMLGMGITQLDAYDRYRCTRLAAVIWTLRHQHGVPIQSKRISIDDNDKQYSMYYMDAADIEALRDDPGILDRDIPTWKPNKDSQMTNFDKIKQGITEIYEDIMSCPVNEDMVVLCDYLATNWGRHLSTCRATQAEVYAEENGTEKPVFSEVCPYTDEAHGKYPVDGECMKCSLAWLNEVAKDD